MTYHVIRPFAGHQVGALLPDLVGHNADYLVKAGFVELHDDDDDDNKPEQKPARTVTKKRKD